YIKRGKMWFEDFFKEFKLKIREPLTSIHETANNVEITIEMPNVDKESIDLEVTQDMIKVKAQKKFEKEEKRKGYYHAEKSYEGFYRAITLPSRVVPEKAKAIYKDNKLIITIPKATKVRKKIKIETK
ncbi:MAG: Hsp20/alpha crystallin family protein, partial [Candidatus Pacearchaeota archaeon]